MLPPPSLDPRSGAFAVAKDENRDRFIGDGRPLNSRERRKGRTHLPYCPRPRRMILGKSETVEITIRDTKDCCCLCEVPHSRLAKQVIVPRISSKLAWTMKIGMSWIRMKLKVWVSQDLLKTCTSAEPVSEPDHCQIGMTAIVMGDVNAVCTLECAHRRPFALELTKINFLLRKTGFWCLAHVIALEMVWVPTWAHAEDAPSQNWYASLPKLPSMPTAVLASAPATAPWTTIGCCRYSGRHVRELESSGAFSCLKTKPVYAENTSSQVTYAGESTSTPYAATASTRCQKLMER